MIYKFDEILNDLMDVFLLGDPDYLLQYKNENHLPDDLLTEFTTSDTGDKVVEQGVVIPMTGIENYPYTILFNLSDGKPELLKPENQLQHQQAGYCLKASHERIYLHTARYLRKFTPEKNPRTENSQKSGHPHSQWMVCRIHSRRTQPANHNLQNQRRRSKRNGKHGADV